jgi:ankyrin repeat protein
VFTRYAVFAGTFIGLLIGFQPSEQPLPTSRQCVERSIPLLQHSAAVWFRERKCVSCHHQALTIATMSLARERGFRIDETKQAYQIAKVANLKSAGRFERLESTGAINGSAGFSYAAFGLAAENTPSSDTTGSIAYYLIGKQAVDGRWPSFSFRPPIEAYPSTLTALAVRALKLYSPPYLKHQSETAIEKGKRWLRNLDPQNNEDAAWRVFGLVWSGASKNDIDAARSQLLTRQRPDGGWAQLPTMDSDAYATGQALVALGCSGFSTKTKAFELGIHFLRQTQHPDGSWLVRTRRRFLPGLPYVETGFPYHEHQFISEAATSWATMALILDSTKGTTYALVRPNITAPHTKSFAYAIDPTDNRLFRAVIEGSAEDVRHALSAGARVNSRSKGGATPLMYAVRDPEKVKILLDAGAAVDAASPQKTTPLMLAAEFVGNRQSMRLLLDAGANVNRERNEYENPLTLAVSTGDQQKVDDLLKAHPNPHLVLVAANVAGWVNDPSMLGHLLDLGLKVDEPLEKGGETLLTTSIADGKPSVVRLLLDRGANPNYIPNHGISPLMMAALNDPGSTKIVEMLLRAGAKRDLKTPQNKTAIGLATKYRNDEIARVLKTGGAN